MELGKYKLCSIQKAARLYGLWIKAERARGKVNRLMAKGADCFSSEMLSAFDDFHAADDEWKRCKQEYADAKKQ